MQSSVVDCEKSARCACDADCGTGLGVLQDVHRVYQQRLEALDRMPSGSSRLQMQVKLLRSWVRDLAEQNTLLTQAVEEMETEATARLILEQRKHAEMACESRAEVMVLRRRLARKDSDLRGLLEVLRRLREFDDCKHDGIHFFYITASDIFGEPSWEQKNMAQGDVQTKIRHK